MFKIIIRDIERELIKGDPNADYKFLDELEIPRSRINDLEYIAIELQKTVEHGGKGVELFVRSVDYEGK